MKGKLGPSDHWCFLFCVCKAQDEGRIIWFRAAIWCRDLDICLGSHFLKTEEETYDSSFPLIDVQPNDHDPEGEAFTSTPQIAFQTSCFPSVLSFRIVVDRRERRDAELATILSVPSSRARAARDESSFALNAARLIDGRYLPRGCKAIYGRGPRPCKREPTNSFTLELRLAPCAD